MGNVDFNALLNIGKQIAAWGGNKGKIDPGIEQSAFDIEVNKTAQQSGVDASEIYSETTIANLMGIEITQANSEERMDDAEEMFAMAGVSKLNQEVTQRVKTSAAIIDSIDIDKVEDAADEQVTFVYIDQNTDGTAKRIYNMGITANDVADFTAGDSTLLGTSALLFRDADFKRQAA